VPTPHPTVAVAAVVLDPDGAVLLIERGRPPGVGRWSLPGGRVELGEALAAAVAREVLEETGLTVEVGPLVTVVERIVPDEDPAAGPGARFHYVILDYLARGAGAPRPGDDARAARWVGPAELAALAAADRTTAGLVEVVERARALAAADAGVTLRP
jgi:8-oxo-dGTP diphosphatase